MDQLLATPGFVVAVVALVTAIGALINAYAQHVTNRDKIGALQTAVNGNMDRRIAAAAAAAIQMHAQTGDVAAAAGAAAAASHAISNTPPPIAEAVTPAVAPVTVAGKPGVFVPAPPAPTAPPSQGDKAGGGS